MFFGNFVLKIFSHSKKKVSLENRHYLIRHYLYLKHVKNVVTWPNWISKAKAIYSTLNGRRNLILGNKFKQVRLYNFFFFFFFNYCTEKLSETCIKLAQRKLRDCLHIFQRFLKQTPGNFAPARSPNNFILS